jgi:uracil permease
MFGATIMVPIIVQDYGLPMSIQTTLFFAGVGTLFFHLSAKFKVPAFLGSSFAFLGGFYAVASPNTGIYANMEPAEKLQYACGGVAMADLLYLLLALVVKLVGVRRVMRFLPPVVTGPIVICIGLSLAPSAVDNASTCWSLALIVLAVVVVCNIWGRGMIQIISALFGGPPNTTYGENTGVLVLSGVYDPMVLRIAAIAGIILNAILPGRDYEFHTNL